MTTAAERTNSEMTDRMSDMVDGVHEMTEHAADLAGQATEMAGKKIKQARKAIRGSMQSAGRSMARMEKSFKQTVAERPLISMGTALAAGMGIALGMWALDCFMNRDR